MGTPKTRVVQLNVRLPRDIAAKAKSIQETDPEFLRQIIFFAITRYGICAYLRGMAEDMNESGESE